MDWIIGLALLLVGAIIGYFIAKQMVETSHTPSEEEAKQESTKQLFVQQASVQLDAAFSALASIEKQCNEARAQFEHFQSQLKTFSLDDGKQQDHFFGEQAAVYLRNAESGKLKESSQTTVQPRDYSGQSSGLLQPESASKTE